MRALFVLGSIGLAAFGVGVTACAAGEEDVAPFGPHGKPATANAVSVDGGANDAATVAEDAGAAIDAPSFAATDASDAAMSTTTSTPDTGVDAGVDAAPVVLTSEPVVRAYGGGFHFYSLSATEVASAGLTLEANPYFFTATEQPPTGGFVAFHRCAAPNGSHLYTTAANCESSGFVFEGDIGLVATTAGACGASPLYRLYSASGDHFYTVSATEMTSAQAGGYTFEGIAGYVWLTQPVTCPHD